MKDKSVAQILRGLRAGPAKPPRSVCGVCGRPATLGVHVTCHQRRARAHRWWRGERREGALTRAELLRELLAFVNRLEPGRLRPEELERREALKDEASRLFARRNDV